MADDERKKKLIAMGYFDDVYVDGDSGGNVTVIDNLTSTSTTSALSANQGRVLDSSITNVYNDLDTRITSNDNAMANKADASHVHSADDITTGTFGTNMIANDAVTTNKLAGGAVTSAKIANNSVLNNHITTNAVTNSKIADGSVTDAKISGTISSSKLPVAGSTAATAGVCWFVYDQATGTLDIRTQ